MAGLAYRPVSLTVREVSPVGKLTFQNFLITKYGLPVKLLNVSVDWL